MSSPLADILGTDEKIVYETRQHWWVLVRDSLLFIAILVLVGIAAGLVATSDSLDGTFGDWLQIGLLVAAVGTAVPVAWNALGWFVERFYITSSKIVYVHGVLNRQVTTTPLTKIDEVTLARPLLGRVFGYGRLDVENASGGHEPLAGLEYLPKPLEVYRILTERSRHQRMVEGGAHRDDDNDGLVDK